MESDLNKDSANLDQNPNQINHHLKSKARTFLLVLILVLIGIIAAVINKELNSKGSSSSTGATIPSPTSTSSKGTPDYISAFKTINEKTTVGKAAVQCFDCGKGNICKVSGESFESRENLGAILSNLNSVKGWKFNQGTVDKTGSNVSGASITDGEITYKVDIYATGWDGNNKPMFFNISYFHPFVQDKFDWPNASSEELASWKEYKDPSGLFTLQYPSSWTQSPTQDYGGQFVLSPAAPNCAHCGGGAGVYLSVIDSSMAETVSSVSAQTSSDATGIVSQTPSFIEKVSGKVACGFPGAGAPGPVAYIPKNGQIIELYSDGIDYNTVSKIFSTVKLTN